MTFRGCYTKNKSGLCGFQFHCGSTSGYRMNLHWIHLDRHTTDRSVTCQYSFAVCMCVASLCDQVWVKQVDRSQLIPLGSHQHTYISGLCAHGWGQCANSVFVLSSGMLLCNYFTGSICSCYFPFS